MTSLAADLATVMAILQAHPRCRHVTILETRAFSTEQFLFKIRADLTCPYHFQARIYYNQGHYDYAYQLFTDIPVLRWDNKEEFANLPTYPHHHHNATGHVVASPLMGRPAEDLSLVLEAIAQSLD